MSNAVAVDFETFYSSKLKYSLTGMHAEQYCKNPLFAAYMVSVSDGANAWSGHPRDLNWNALSGKLWLSHNRAFDNTVYDELVLRKLVPYVPRAGWACTANMTSYLCNRRSLAESVEHLFKVKLDKAARSDANNKHWPADFSPSEQATMLKYAKADAIWCWKLWDTFSAQWPEHERLLSNLTIDQGRFGVQMNRELLNEYIIQAHDLRKSTEALLPWMEQSSLDDDWDDFNPVPTSTKCIAEQCRRAGIPAPPCKARDGADAYEEWEATYVAAHPWIAAMTNWRSVNKLLKTFETAKARLRPDSTMPFDLKYFGAHTGRWSGGSKLNFQNFRKVPIFVGTDGLMISNEAKIALTVKHIKKEGRVPDWVRGKPIDFRRLIGPRPGKKLFAADLAAIEPRVEAWFCKDEKLMGMIRNGASVYEAFARANMGWTGGNLKDEDPDRYQLTKIQVLGLGYGCGWEKFITIGASYGIDLTVNDPEWIEEVNPFTAEVTKVSGFGTYSKSLVTKFRADNPRIVALWKSLDEAFKQSVGEDFVLRMPSGRALRYERVRCETRIVPDEKTGKPRRKSVFTADIGGRRVSTYGGSLTENLVQSTARDCFAYHLLRLTDAGFRVLFSVHDEAIIEADSGQSIEEVEHIMSQCPEWLAGCPIAVEAKEIPFYTK